MTVNDNMSAKNIRFIIKCIDEKGKCLGYIWNDCTGIMSKHGSFIKDNTFETIKDAENHIETILDSGWYRSDITKDNFEIVEVKQYEDLDFCYCWYTEDYYNEHKNEIAKEVDR